MNYLQKAQSNQKPTPEILVGERETVTLTRGILHTLIMDGISRGVQFALEPKGELNRFVQQEAWNIINEDLTR